jgi:Ser/Thr protein kinase RdoA (MazF antagonist)
MQIFRAVARRVREELDRLGEGREVFGIIHRDLKLENVLYDGERVGAIDFDMCGWGYYLFDLSVVHRCLRPRHKDRQEPLWKAFLEGYRRKRPLPEDLARHIETFDAMQRVAAVNRTLELLARSDTRDQARGPRFLHNAVTWLQRTYLNDKG